jgi:hypothetical protein
MKSHHRGTIQLATLLLVSAALSSATPVTHAGSGDKQTEKFLLSSEVLNLPRGIPSSTYPLIVELRNGPESRNAAYKYVHIQQEDGVPCLESYRHEAAAYRLDRALGLNLVPVAVVRHLGGAEGAVIEWIPDAISVKKLRETGEPPLDRRLTRQQALMDLLDALILNVNRTEKDQLVTLDDWGLHLIDHARSFCESVELPPGFGSEPIRLPPAVLANLEKLTKKSLGKILDGLVSEAQIDALLARRDKILEKIEADRRQYGDAMVLRD